MTTLLDLPVLPPDRDTACATSFIQDVYICERGSLTNAEELQGFIQRWKPLFLLEPDPSCQVPLENPERIFEIMQKLKTKSDEDLDFESDEVKEAMNVMMPPALMKAFFLARHFLVGHDIAMVRLYLDPHPELLEELRGQSYGGRAKQGLDY
ncbi:MAG: hypothetical protein WC824_09510 [Bacteroidota bacterium]|jgi:hypothetical protein